MQDATYYRARADLCLEIAELMSDSTAADALRVEAVQNRACAVAFEHQTGVRRGGTADPIRPRQTNA
jgi:hypothetical protein